MSKVYQIAEHVRDHLSDNLSELDGVAVVAYRQHSLAEELEKAVGMAGGALLVVAPGGGRNPAPDAARRASVETTFSVAVWSLPVVAEDAGVARADDILEAVVGCLHGATFDANMGRRATFTEWAPVENPTFLIYNINFVIKYTIPQPERTNQ